MTNFNCWEGHKSLSCFCVRVHLGNRFYSKELYWREVNSGTIYKGEGKITGRNNVWGGRRVAATEGSPYHNRPEGRIQGVVPAESWQEQKSKYPNLSPPAFWCLLLAKSDHKPKSKGPPWDSLRDEKGRELWGAKHIISTTSH